MNITNLVYQKFRTHEIDRPDYDSVPDIIVLDLFWKSHTPSLIHILEIAPNFNNLCLFKQV